MKIILTSAAILSLSVAQAEEKRPNILFAIADDMSYPYMSAYGTAGVSTPAFDEVAQRGILLNNGYVTSPGSSPSRASILTGHYTWTIGAAGTHGSYFPDELVTYTDLLHQAGYHVGFTGKGWAPGAWADLGKRKCNPAGYKEYNSILNKTPYRGIRDMDYFENFKAFRNDDKSGKPFCFWYGGRESHRPYEKDSWKKAGKDLKDVVVPPYLPDTPTVRGDLADYLVETEWFDKHLGKMLRYLEERGELDNTLIVVTADNGMPFPSSKASGYDIGVHVPMAICWGSQIKPHKKAVDDFVSSVDFAATFLDAAGVDNKESRAMTSRSLLPWLTGEKGAKAPDRILYGKERHVYSARPNNAGYPIRAIRKGNLLYVYNFEPSLYPAGDPTKAGSPSKVYVDIDGGPSKSEIIERSKEEYIAPYFELAVAKRPQEQLFDIVSDPQCMNNLMDDNKFSKKASELKKELFATLKETGDTRLTTPEVWDAYPSSQWVEKTGSLVRTKTDSSK